MESGFYVINEDGADYYFPTLTEAITDAQRQAKDEPESTFLILQPVASVRLPDVEPTVKWLTAPEALQGMAPNETSGG